MRHRMRYELELSVTGDGSRDSDRSGTTLAGFFTSGECFTKGLHLHRTPPPLVACLAKSFFLFFFTVIRRWKSGWVLLIILPNACTPPSSTLYPQCKQTNSLAFARPFKFYTTCSVHLITTTKYQRNGFQSTSMLVYRCEKKTSTFFTPPTQLPTCRFEWENGEECSARERCVMDRRQANHSYFFDTTLTQQASFGYELQNSRKPFFCLLLPNPPASTSSKQGRRDKKTLKGKTLFMFTLCSCCKLLGIEICHSKGPLPMRCQAVVPEWQQNSFGLWLYGPSPPPFPFKTRPPVKRGVAARADASRV